MRGLLAGLGLMLVLLLGVGAQAGKPLPPPPTPDSCQSCVAAKKVWCKTCSVCADCQPGYECAGHQDHARVTSPDGCDPLPTPPSLPQK
jgi:hypothetical protein